jgi:hypothetical protein
MALTNESVRFYQVQNMSTFEEVALKFVNVGEQDALRTFLLHKLDHLGKEERSQITMVATWCTELYLDKVRASNPCDLNTVRINASGTFGAKHLILGSLSSQRAS